MPKCARCDHSQHDHYTTATTPTDADGCPNLPYGSILPCDVIMADGSRCGCLQFKEKSGAGYPRQWVRMVSGETAESLGMYELDLRASGLPVKIEADASGRFVLYQLIENRLHGKPEAL